VAGIEDVSKKKGQNGMKVRHKGKKSRKRIKNKTGKYQTVRRAEVNSE